jgi:hypothetical protein
MTAGLNGPPHVAHFVNDREFRQHIAHAESVLFIHDAGRGRRTCSRRYLWPPAGRSGRRFAAAMGLINELLEAPYQHALRHQGSQKCRGLRR